MHVNSTGWCGDANIQHELHVQTITDHPPSNICVTGNSATAVIRPNICRSKAPILCDTYSTCPRPLIVTSVYVHVGAVPEVHPGNVSWDGCNWNYTRSYIAGIKWSCA